VNRRLCDFFGVDELPGGRLQCATMPTVTVSYSIPYACQFASTDLVREFVSKERSLATDPRWAEYGAGSPAEYAHWAMRSCGVVCIKMAVEGIAKLPPRSVMEWVNEGLALDGYLTEIRRDRPVEIGWKHASLAELARRHGCAAEPAPHLSLESIADHIRADRMVIASVTSELGEDAPITRRNGHLIVIHGVALGEPRHGETGRVETIIAHNPSGRRPETQIGAHIPAGRFMEGFSGRGIIVGKPGALQT
jgi:hypothetical protein